MSNIIAELEAEPGSEDSQDDLLDAIEEFDETTISSLLNDEDVAGQDYPVELTPDFTDSNVLSQLLDEDDGTMTSESKEAEVIDDIQELDNMEFDELLANIEEESSSLNMAEEIELQIANQQQEAEPESKDSADYVSIDSLLSDSFETASKDQPYDKSMVDVGLDEFADVAEDANLIDVDDADEQDQEDEAVQHDVGQEGVDQIGRQDCAEGRDRQKKDAHAENVSSWSAHMLASCLEAASKLPKSGNRPRRNSHRCQATPVKQEIRDGFLAPRIQDINPVRWALARFCAQSPDIDSSCTNPLFDQKRPDCKGPGERKTARDAGIAVRAAGEGKKLDAPIRVRLPLQLLGQRGELVLGLIR